MKRGPGFLTTERLMKRTYKATKELTREYDVVTREMIMDHGKLSKKSFAGAMEVLKRRGDVYSPKHGQFKVAEER